MGYILSIPRVTNEGAKLSPRLMGVFRSHEAARRYAKMMNLADNTFDIEEIEVVA